MRHHPSTHSGVESITFGPTALFAFLAGSLTISAAPGPAQARVLARSVSESRRSRILAAVGLSTGTIILAAVTARGNRLDPRRARR